jgi:hypothetical protein
VVVDGPGVHDTHHAVVHEHEHDREQVGDPFLVAGEDGDHHEEVEVRLRAPAGEVDEDGR